MPLVGPAGAPGMSCFLATPSERAVDKFSSFFQRKKLNNGKGKTKQKQVFSFISKKSEKKWGGGKGPPKTIGGRKRPKKICFRHFGGFWVLFSDSLRFFTSFALFFVPKDPLGSDNKPTLFLQKNEILSKTRSAKRRPGGDLGAKAKIEKYFQL